MSNDEATKLAAIHAASYSMCENPLKRLFNNYIQHTIQNRYLLHPEIYRKVSQYTGYEEFFEYQPEQGFITFIYNGETYKMSLECVDNNYNMFENDIYKNKSKVEMEEIYFIVYNYIDDMMRMLNYSLEFLKSDLRSNRSELYNLLTATSVEMNPVHSIRILNYDNFKALGFKIEKM